MQPYSSVSTTSAFSNRTFNRLVSYRKSNVNSACCRRSPCLPQRAVGSRLPSCFPGDCSSQCRSRRRFVRNTCFSRPRAVFEVFVAIRYTLAAHGIEVRQFGAKLKRAAPHRPRETCRYTVRGKSGSNVSTPRITTNLLSHTAHGAYEEVVSYYITKNFNTLQL